MNAKSHRPIGAGLARRTHQGRAGVAAIWALAVLAAVSGLSAAAVAQFTAARRQVDIYRKQTQADWLARSGCELAIARLLAGPKDYTGETATPIPKGEVKITVRPDPKKDGAYRIECEARYPVGERAVVVRTVERVYLIPDIP